MPRRQKKYHYIYKTTCQVTGKFYIGMHSTDTLEDGYLGSGKILRYSIAKHGEQNHKREIIEMCPSLEVLKLREKEIVNEELLADPLNINLKYGGEGGWDHILSSESRIEIQRRRSSAGGKAAWKNPTSRETLLQMASDKMKRLNEDGRINYATFTGRKHSEETKQKISQSRKKKTMV